MSFRSLPFVSFALLATFATACRDSGDGDDDDTGPDAANGELTIQDVQNDATPVGTAVTLRGVVVTAKDTYGPRKGNFYVAEPGGGEFSGVLVFLAPLSQVEALEVGDLVDIIGAQKDEFVLKDMAGVPLDDKTVTEIGPLDGGEMTVTKVGEGTVPAPKVLDVLAIGQMTEVARELEYEKWEGVLVTVNNVTVTSELSTISSSEPDPMFVGFDITGVLEVDSSLAEIPYAADPPRFVNGGDCLASITGMADYFFNYKILPRATADIVMSGTGCPAAEAVGTCADGIDNDANGFLDCADRGCRLEPTCTSATTVVMVQNGTVPVDTRVDLSNVVVTAVSRNNKNLWVSDSLTPAPYNSISVFRGNAAGVAVLPPEIVVGARVNVNGVVDEFTMVGTGTNTQIASAPTVTFVSAPAGLPTAFTGLTVATLTDDTTGEPYEGALVELTNVRMIGTPTGTNTFGVRYFGVMGSANVVFESDDDIRVALTQADGTCFSFIRGVWSWQGFDGRWSILPLTDSASFTNNVVVATNQADCP